MHYGFCGIQNQNNAQYLYRIECIKKDYRSNGYNVKSSMHVNGLQAKHRMECAIIIDRMKKKNVNYSHEIKMLMLSMKIGEESMWYTN